MPQYFPHSHSFTSFNLINSFSLTYKNVFRNIPHIEEAQTVFGVLVYLHNLIGADINNQLVEMIYQVFVTLLFLLFFDAIN